MVQENQSEFGRKRVRTLMTERSKTRKPSLPPLNLPVAGAAKYSRREGEEKLEQLACTRTVIKEEAASEKIDKAKKAIPDGKQIAERKENSQTTYRSLSPIACPRYTYCTAAALCPSKSHFYKIG